MAYTATYKQKIKFNSEKTKSAYSILETKFRFKEEVAPKDRKVIRKRINDLLDEAKREIGIPRRFFIEESDAIPSYHYMSRNLAFDRRSLGFDLYCGIPKITDQIIRLDAINQYILKGKKE